MKYFLNLLRFGEGGDGGNGSGTGSATGNATGEAAPSGDNSGVEIPSSVPERAKKLYAEVMKGKSASHEEPKTEAKVEETAKESKPTYEEMIKSDEYKDAHREYMEKTINDRIKKYKGLEEKLKSEESLLATIGAKYGLNTEDKDYLAKLTEAIENDDSYYEKYAEDHDMTPAEARKIVTLERKVKETEDVLRAQEEERVRQAQFRVIQQNAAKTQARFPNFNFAAELQNPNFVSIMRATNGDTTAAYIATHHDEIVQGVAQTVAQKAQVASANAIASGQNRPVENGVGGSVPTDVQINFNNMGLNELRAWADQQRRLQRKK